MEKGTSNVSVNSDISTPGEVQSLTSEHETYLIERHGTTNLDPLPSADPSDPLNWPDWEKNAQIASMSFTAFSLTFMAAGISVCYESMAEEYGTTVHHCSYLTAAMIIIFGFLPLLWVPLSSCYGRKWFLVGGSFACFALNLGAGWATTYAQQLATRVLVAVGVSTGLASGGAIVHDLCFSHERAFKNGWWSMAFVIGTPTGPFICGFIQYHLGTKWVMWIFAIMNFVQFLLWLPMRETLRTPKKLSVPVFAGPFLQAKNKYVVLLVLAALITFAYNNVCLVVLKPISMAAFKLNSQQLGLNYLSLIIGSIIGEALSGKVSDFWMKYCTRKRGERVIVDRLWQSYVGYAACITGLFVWGAFLDQAGSKWNIRPLVGDAIAACGNNIVATVITSYAIDTDPAHASDIALFLNLWRSIWAFLAPFYLPDMFEKLEYLGSAGLMNGLVIVFGAGATGLAHWMGRHKKAVMEGKV